MTASRATTTSPPLELLSRRPLSGCHPLATVGPVAEHRPLHRETAGGDESTAR